MQFEARVDRAPAGADSDAATLHEYGSVAQRFERVIECQRRPVSRAVSSRRCARSWLVAALVLVPAQALAQVPAAPANLRIDPDDSSRIIWDHPNDQSITGYEYRARRMSESEWTPDWTAFRSDADTTHATLAQIAAGVTHVFELRALNAHGAGPSSSLTLTWSALPATPANLRAESGGNGDVVLRWDHPNDPSITGYESRLRVGSESEWRRDWSAFEADADTTSVRITNIAPGVTIHKELRARNGNGPGPASSVTVTARRRPAGHVNVSSTTVNLGGTVSLTATASDPDGGPVTYLWSAPSGSFDATDRASVTWTAPSVASRVPIRLTVTDDEGESGVATVHINVRDNSGDDGDGRTDGGGGSNLLPDNGAGTGTTIPGSGGGEQETEPDDVGEPRATYDLGPLPSTWEYVE